MRARLSIVFLCLAHGTLGTFVLSSAERCIEIFTVEKAIQNAPKLDGKVVCIKGDLRIISDDRGTIFAELTPQGSAGTRAGKPAVGIVEWAHETGVEGDKYNPDSFRLLDSFRAPVIEVVFRGAIVYERGYFKNLSPLLPPGRLYDPIRNLSYPVEFVLLEVVSAKLIKKVK